MANLADHPEFEERTDGGKDYLVARILDPANFESLAELAEMIYGKPYQVITHTTEYHIRVVFPGTMSKGMRTSTWGSSITRVWFYPPGVNFRQGAL